MPCRACDQAGVNEVVIFSQDIRLPLPGGGNLTFSWVSPLHHMVQLWRNFVPTPLRKSINIRALPPLLDVNRKRREDAKKELGNGRLW